PLSTGRRARGPAVRARGRARRGGFRALRLFVDRSADANGPADDGRSPLRRSAGAGGARWTLSARSGDRAALRRRLLPRGADGGGSVPVDPLRHLELERL